jgi:two-component system sensor histidine kinase HydH
MSGGGEIVFHFNEIPKIVTLAVEDSGHGISKENQPNVFRPFFTTKSRGTGLGLAICKKIIDAHGGSISLRSTPNRGTKVTVQLPAEPSLRSKARLG